MKTKATRRKLPVKRAAAPKKKVLPIPAGYSAVTPYLARRGAAQAIEFYKKAFGAKEILRMPGPEGRIGHAELQIGDARAMAAGVKLVRAVEDQFYGDRSGSIEDPFGHLWHVATHTEDLTMAEVKRRAGKMAEQAGGSAGCLGRHVVEKATIVAVKATTPCPRTSPRCSSAPTAAQCSRGSCCGRRSRCTCARSRGRSASRRGRSCGS